MAMTKKERARLERILASLERGLAYIDQPNVFLAVKSNSASSLEFRRTVNAGQIEHCMRRDDPMAFVGEQAIGIVDKLIGSEFTLVRNARRELSEFLAPEIIEEAA